MAFDRMASDRSALTSWLMRRVFSVYRMMWWTRAKTLGVRIVVLDGDKVLLVRHTYLSGWYLPGGAVDRGETIVEAAIRELREEAGIACERPPVLHGVYRNRAHSSRDHVACFVVRHFKAAPRAPDWEIAESGFFPCNALPEGTSRATRARLAEIIEGQPISADW